MAANAEPVPATVDEHLSPESAYRAKEKERRAAERDAERSAKRAQRDKLRAEKEAERSRLRALKEKERAAERFCAIFMRFINMVSIEHDHNGTASCVSTQLGTYNCSHVGRGDVRRQT
jgi:hypothetical protein